MLPMLGPRASAGLDDQHISLPRPRVVVQEWSRSSACPIDSKSPDFQPSEGSPSSLLHLNLRSRGPPVSRGHHMGVQNDICTGEGRAALDLPCTGQLLPLLVKPTGVFIVPQARRPDRAVMDCWEGGRATQPETKSLSAN